MLQHTPAIEVERESEIAVAPVSLVGISLAGEKIIKVWYSDDLYHSH